MYTGLMQSIYNYSNYRKYLSDTLKDRMATNGSYSLRSFAKNLGLAPSMLSEVISGKKNLSNKFSAKISEQLKLTNRKSKYFQLLVQFETTQNEEVKSIIQESLRLLNPQKRNVFELNVEQFQLIVKWYHFAILEMTFLNYELTPHFISQSLGIAESEAKQALELLIHLEFLEAISKNKYQKKSKKILVQSSQPNLALREFHRTMLLKAQASLTNQSFQEKIIGSETIPINIADIEKAKAIIEDCFERIIMLSEQSENKQHVYHLGIQFFKLTTGIR